jgi:thiamine-monophosphate kinase
VRRLRDVGEHGWIARLARRVRAGRSPGVLVGVGDDAAVLRPGRRPLLLTTDTLLEGVHFRAGWTTPAGLGRRAFRVNASDLAAMGGIPRFALLALEVPPRMAVAQLDALVDGFTAAARGSGADLVGGNLVAGRRLSITVLLVGEAPGRVVTRAGARPGDGLYLTGTIGGAGLAVRCLTAGRRGRLPDPPLRVRAGTLLARVARAMIDVSDGLMQDVRHLCNASRVAAEIDASTLPLAAGLRDMPAARALAFAATAGEDYELIVAVPAAAERMLARLRPRLGCRLTRIGRLAAGRPAVRLLDATGRSVVLPRAGYDHFR